MANGYYQTLRDNILCTLDDPAAEWIVSLPNASFHDTRGAPQPCSNPPKQ